MFVGEIFWTVVIGFAVVGTIGYALSIYNGLVALRNNIARSWANIDVLLKQRHDELPKLVKTCEGYMRHERGVFDKLSEARAALAGAKSVAERAGAEGMLNRALGAIFAVAEAYPDLKANQNMALLQEELTSTENKVAFARQAYNDSVMGYNTARESFPTNVVAGALGFQAADLFQLESEAERAAPKVSFA